MVGLRISRPPPTIGAGRLGSGIDRRSVRHMSIDLAAAWTQAHLDFVDLARGLDEAQWTTATACPGWTVGDVVAHVVSLESILLGRSDHPHQPGWHELPHADTDFRRSTEVAVDLRRTRSRDEVVAELREVVTDRAEAIQQVEMEADVATPFGQPAPLAKVLRMRTFDTWVHEFDIRQAIGDPGHLDTDGAQVTLDTLVDALPFTWGKKVGAPVGASARIIVTGPGLTADRTVVVGDNGRAAFADTAEPTVTLTMSWPDYVILACGRGDAPIEISGDPDLGARLAASLTITP